MSMRTIKFRGQRPNGKWKVSESIVKRLDGRILLGGYIVNPETVGQFTGLFDRNGKEIYEGDILGFTTKREMGYPTDGIKIALPIVFGICNPRNDTLSEYVGFWVEESCGYRGSISYEVGSHGAKVIGNIHDNPELINV